MSSRSPFTIEWTPPNARRRKFVFEPRPTGGYDREEFEEQDDGWRFVGSEIVSNVSLETPSEIVLDTS
ncbi:hypothetical protein EL22_05595 [Halostagnicola sp. A56]|uniref:hypothetical protein n=1 Tax=Halostagnicola sp. A56 TaxID=1495067 RepID=UPI00049FD800|nr:hypothetical protein [Halostagnicola sp. A56]KDE58325.1 hypothetical protein EL22_05595 [Halostagnicola sp. A56]